MGDNRSFASGRFAFGIEGEFAGFVRKVSGGAIKTEVITHNLGTSSFQRKNAGLLNYDNLTFEIAMGHGKPIWDWIMASWQQDFQQKNCELQLCNFNHEVQLTRSFQDVYIAKLTVPAFDAGSKEPGYFTVELNPSAIRYEQGDGKRIVGAENVSTKKWLCSNFRLQLGDLPCERTAKIDSFTWEQKIVNARTGGSREYAMEPAALTVPNLKISLSMADVALWAAWHKSFVIDGKCTDADELSGSITFLGPDLVEELAIIDLKNVGMISMEQQALEANAEQVARFDVELYVEEMHFTMYSL